ncbi:glycoside hydrolase [Lentilactobacillus curieae]|uniref:Glycoside hydrolase n=1 Tax=Lentilactobacillus curieae TaxID=1138822 RepID=A0A1S6QGC8_9LACO|nr:C40 family peptidase [Lentilactobacillus curieae]AQW20667.1 glycoside hydrolase [Lentilactobacillus curieae]
MKFHKGFLALAFAGAIFGGTAVSASADTYNQANSQPTYSTNYNYYQPTSYGYSYDQANNGSQAYNGQTTNTTTATSSTPTSDKAQSVVDLAKKLAGQNIPYVWGGESLSGMDCSGLTDYVFQKAANISLGHYTVTQESKVTTESVANAKPGDLLFWGGHGSTHHVAIYIGNNQYVAAPQPGQNVDIETINSAFMPSFAGHVNGLA